MVHFGLGPTSPIVRERRQDLHNAPIWLGEKPPRVISVREALLLMGFSKAFRFPEGLGLAARYQMAVDSVSPVFSVAIANTA